MAERRVLVAGKVLPVAAERIALVCERRGVSLSAAVREALGMWLEKWDPRAARVLSQRAGVVPPSEPVLTPVPEQTDRFDPWADVPAVDAAGDLIPDDAA